MKKFSLSVLMVVAFVFCYAQPKIQFEQTTYDFGKIHEEGGKVTGKFVFTNVGNEPLELTNVRPGCGCTAANYTKGQIAPGAQGYIEATYNPYNRPGNFHKNIRVTTNEPQFIEDSKTPPHMIFIKGEVIKRPPTEFERTGYTKTAGMARFFEPSVTHNLLNTESVLDTFKVRNFWDQPVNYVLESNNDYITEVYRSFGSDLMPGEEGFIVIKYDASKRAAFGQLKDAVTYMTNDNQEPKKQLHYAVNIKEDFSKLTAKQLKKAPISVYTETQLDFGQVQKNSTTEKEFVITNTGKNPLLIRKVESSSVTFKAYPSQTEIPSGASATIKVVYKSSNRPGVQNGTIEVITNDPKNSNQIINLKVQTL